MNVLIYGYGLKHGGFYSAMYFLKRGHNVRITDIRDEFSLGEGAFYLQSQGVEIISGEHRVKDFEWADVTIKTPAVAPDSPFLQHSKCTKNDYSFLFSNKKIKDIKIIGITGTQKKSITSAAVCHALNKMGKDAAMCGNMGISPFSVLEKLEEGADYQYLICEFSSASIRDTFEYSQDCIPKFDLVTFTNTVQDTNPQNVENTKILYNKIESFRKLSKKMLCFADTKDQLAKLTKMNVKNIGTVEYYSTNMQKSIPYDLRPAYAILRQLGFKSSAINNALKSFKGIPHRNEIVLSNSELLVINDSSSTIPSATGFSVDNFNGMPVHLICGGSGRYLNPNPMVETLKKVASITLLDGTFTRDSLIAELEKEGIRYSGPFTDMKKAVKSAMSHIKPKNSSVQVLILSPGCSAFELFSNEYERGDAFKKCFENPKDRKSGKKSKKKPQKKAESKKEESATQSPN